MLLQTKEGHLRKLLGADKEKVHRDQTLGNTGGNNNNAMFDWRSGCQSEDKCNCHTHMTSIMTTTYFCTNRQHYQLLFSYFFHYFCRFFVYIISGYIRMLCGNVCVVAANIKMRTCGV